jgi:hypothetical protein
MAPNAIDSLAPGSHPYWPVTISQLFMAPTAGHSLPPSHVCPPLAGIDCLQTYSQSWLLTTDYLTNSSLVSILQICLCMDPTENTASYNSSLVVCVTGTAVTCCILAALLNCVIECLQCCNLKWASSLMKLFQLSVDIPHHTCLPHTYEHTLRQTHTDTVK